MRRTRWPKGARLRYAVRGTVAQASAWVVAATHEGITVPAWIARAADVYARHLANIQLRKETTAFRRSERAWKERKR